MSKDFKETYGTVGCGPLRDRPILGARIRRSIAISKNDGIFLKTRFFKFSNSVAARMDFPCQGPRRAGPNLGRCRPALFARKPLRRVVVSLLKRFSIVSALVHLVVLALWAPAQHLLWQMMEGYFGKTNMEITLK